MQKITGKSLKNFSKIISGLAIVISCAFNYVCINAKETLTIDDYETAVNAVLQEYNTTCTVLDYDPEKPITQEVIQNGIDNAINYAESLQISEVYQDTMLAGPSEMSLTSMPVTKNVSKTFLISNVYGNATMAFVANVTVDYQNGYVEYVNSSSVYQYGAFMNFDGWTTGSITTYVNTPSAGYIRAYISGTATFSYTEPTTGLRTGYTSYINKTLDVECV